MELPADERRPVTTTDDLDTLEDAGVLEGYGDGREGFPCGENRSRSYWHGWRNGMIDSGRMEMPAETRILARAYIARERIAATIRSQP